MVQLSHASSYKVAVLRLPCAVIGYSTAAADVPGHPDEGGNLMDSTLTRCILNQACYNVSWQPQSTGSCPCRLGAVVQSRIWQPAHSRLSGKSCPEQTAAVRQEHLLLLIHSHVRRLFRQCSR